MATIVIHGTMTLSGAKHAHWWWDSWDDGGFLGAVSGGMLQAAGEHDLWHAAGQPVASIAALQTRLTTHQGHFIWTGADDYITREAGAHHLVRYLNVLHELSPREPISLIAHSHGCNVVKLASGNANLSPDLFFDRAVFLACPHFVKASRPPSFPYQLDPDRFGTILNLYSEDDSVQVEIAQAFPGFTGVSPDMGSHSQRIEHDPEATYSYDNWPLPTLDKGTTAHTAMHGSHVGFMIGYWLASDAGFGQILEAFGDELLPIPAGDHGA